MTVFMQNQTADGPSDEVKHKGGVIQIQVVGNFSAATTATLQVNQDNLGFIDLDEPAAIFSKADINAFTMLKGATYRLNVESADGSTDLTASSLS